MEGTCGTCEEILDMLEAAIKEMSPREKAQLRVELRRTYGLPAQPAPDLWTN
jgi:hypothetical protein